MRRFVLISIVAVAVAGTIIASASSGYLKGLYGLLPLLSAAILIIKTPGI